MQLPFVLWIAALAPISACQTRNSEYDSTDFDSGGPLDNGPEAGGRTGADSGAGARDPGAGAGGAGGTGACSAQRAEVRQIADGTVEPGTTVELDRVVATSQKFLVARGSSTGSCVWGVFVSAAVAAAAEHTGVLVVAYGTPAKARADGELEPCRSGTDAIPDDVAIGDMLLVSGKAQVYEPSACTNGVAVGAVQVQAVQACPIAKIGTLAPPEPAAIDAQTADQLARGSDAALLRAWAGVVVRLTGVSGVRDGTNPDIVGAFGTIRLNETSLEVRDKIYYADLGGGGPGAGGESPEFDYPTMFNRIDGLVLFDRCNWVLAPRDKCQDFAPKSRDCR